MNFILIVFVLNFWYLATVPILLFGTPSKNLFFNRATFILVFLFWQNNIFERHCHHEQFEALHRPLGPTWFFYSEFLPVIVRIGFSPKFFGFNIPVVFRNFGPADAGNEVTASGLRRPWEVEEEGHSSCFCQGGFVIPLSKLVYRKNEYYKMKIKKQC